MIFVDTSFWVALRNRGNPHHEEAKLLLKSHERTRLITSNHVRGETWTFLRRRCGHAAAVSYLDGVQNSSRIDVLPVELVQETAALRWLRQHDEREYSFVDATSFALMRKLRVSRAFAFDGDFSAAGFVELRP